MNFGNIPDTAIVKSHSNHRKYKYFCPISEETKAYADEITCPKSHKQ